LHLTTEKENFSHHLKNLLNKLKNIKNLLGSFGVLPSNK